jgi:hypothetical protein
VLLFATGLIAWWRPSTQKSRKATATERRPEDVALAGR